MAGKAKPKAKAVPRKTPGKLADDDPKSPLRLRIEKVPEPIWGKNLRSEEFGLGKYRWDKLRKAVLDANGPACAICGDTEKPQGHEVWEYRVVKKGLSTAKLIKIEIICSRCHHIHHWGMTQQLLSQGHIGQDAIAGLEAHFQRVNSCTMSDFNRHVIETSIEWQERSQGKWDIDWGDFGPMVAEAAARRAAKPPKN